MAAATAHQTHDLLAIVEPEQTRGTYQASQEFEQPGTSDDDARNSIEADITANDSRFEPNRIYYIQNHHMSSKTITTIDVTGKIPLTFVHGKNVDETFREAAKKIGTAKDAVPAFVFKKNHWYNKSYRAYAGTDDSAELAEWKHPMFSTGTATLEFPADSVHAPHNLAVKPVSWSRRTNEFVVDSVPYSWHFDDRYKSHRMTLSKRISGVDSTIARYSQKWSALSNGGVLLIDDREVKDLVALLTTCIMLRRLEQRRWERSGSAGGGGG